VWLVDVIKLVVPAAASTASAKVMLDWWLGVAARLGFVGRDMNKPGHPPVAEAGGVWVVLSSVFGILTYIALDTYLSPGSNSIALLTVSTVLLLAGLIGFLDDMLGWKKGISPLKRVLLTLPISLPLVSVEAGSSRVELPLLGVLDLGLAYPLLVVPVGVLGASNGFNMIAGYNGLEALQAAVLLSFASLLMLIRGQLDAFSTILLVLAPVLLFYFSYNKYPAKMFPGNSFTYGMGALYASLAIYWNFEKYAVASFALYLVELALFIRGLLNGVYKENFGRVLSDGSLEPPYDKSYSLTHVAIKVVKRLRGRCREVDVVYFIVLLQFVVSATSLLVVLYPL
jgi:UDP-N-acetylglucosamine--dolichyl-phosphate N-acetylglucosaminephosphotransferase